MRVLGAIMLLTIVTGLSSCSLFDKRVDVLLIGDSIMNQSGPFLESMLRTQPALSDAKVHVKAVNGSGLLTPGVFDWSTEAVALAEEYDPDITVVLFVGNYTNTDWWLDDTGAPVPGDYGPVFYEEWGEEASSLTSAVQATGSQVYWVLPPPFYGDEGLRRQELLRETYVQMARAMPGVGLIDGRSPLSTGTGQFTWKLPSIDTGEEVAVRQSDSLHLTPDGGKLLSRQISQEISPVLQQLRQQRATA